MGVKGLTSEVTNPENNLGVPISLENKRVLIDASSFLHWVVGRLCDRARRGLRNQQPTPFDHVAQSMAINLSSATFRQELTRLLQKLRDRNISALFITDNLLELDDDGPKARTKADRYKQRRKDAERWLRVVLNMPAAADEDDNDKDDDSDNFLQAFEQDDSNDGPDEEKVADQGDEVKEDCSVGSTEAEQAGLADHAETEATASSPAPADEPGHGTDELQPTLPGVPRVMYPAGAARILKEVCRDFGLEVLNAEGEADWFLARRFAKKKAISAIVSSDSDFFVFEDCRCICDFNALFYREEVIIYSQPAIAAYFGFAGLQYEGFLDFVALQGNDYTARYSEAVKAALEQRYAALLGQRLVGWRRDAMLVKLAWQEFPSSGVRGLINMLDFQDREDISRAWEMSHTLYSSPKESAKKVEEDSTVPPEPFRELRPDAGEPQRKNAEKQRKIAEKQRKIAKQAYAGYLSRATARAVCAKKFIGHPAVDPIALLDPQLGMHHRCAQVRRALYDVLGLYEIVEYLWNTGEEATPAVQQSASTVLEEDDHNAWQRLAGITDETRGKKADRILQALGQAIREQLDAPKTVVLDPKQLLCRAGMDETQRIYILPALFYAWTCVGPHSFLSQGTDADRWARAFLTAMLDDATEDVQRNDNFNDLRTYLRRLAELTPINAFEGVDPVTNTTMLLWSELVAFNEMVDVLHVVREEADTPNFCLTVFCARMCHYLEHPEEAHAVVAHLLEIVSDVLTPHVVG